MKSPFVSTGIHGLISTLDYSPLLAVLVIAFSKEASFTTHTLIMQETVVLSVEIQAHRDNLCRSNERTRKTKHLFTIMLLEWLPPIGYRLRVSEGKSCSTQSGTLLSQKFSYFVNKRLPYLKLKGGK